MQHEKTHNKESDKQICQECGKTLGSTAALRRHVKVQHCHGFSCPECSQVFSKKIELNHHVRTHRLEKPHQCGHCDNKFSLKAHLDNHLAIHSNAKSDDCCSLCSEKNMLEIVIEKFRSRINEINRHKC